MQRSAAGCSNRFSPHGGSAAPATAEFVLVVEILPYENVHHQRRPELKPVQQVPEEEEHTTVLIRPPPPPPPPPLLCEAAFCSLSESLSAPG